MPTRSLPVPFAPSITRTIAPSCKHAAPAMNIVLFRARGVEFGETT